MEDKHPLWAKSGIVLFVTSQGGDVFFLKSSYRSMNGLVLFPSKIHFQFGDVAGRKQFHSELLNNGDL